MGIFDDERNRRAIDLDPASMVRSVIATPLLERIRRERIAAEFMRKQAPTLARAYKNVVFLNEDFPGKLKGAQKAVLQMLERIKTRRPPEAGKRRVRPWLKPAPGSAELLLGVVDHFVAEHLLSMSEAHASPILHIWPSRWDVIIDINLKFRELPDYSTSGPGKIARRRRPSPFNVDPRVTAKQVIADHIAEAKRRCGVTDPLQDVDSFKTGLSTQYVFARLEGRVLLELVNIDRDAGGEWAHMDQRAHDGDAARLGAAAGEPAGAESFRAIHQIWPDFDLHNFTHRSMRTVKADAAHNSFNAYGEGITWAVVDSGIDARHPHFTLHENIDRASSFHRDFTRSPEPDALTDAKGHGTHVAGIIAGQQKTSEPPAAPPEAPYDEAWRLAAVELERDPRSVDDIPPKGRTRPVGTIGGIAPKCKLVSLKVLDEFGIGKASSVISAIEHIQKINGYGRDIKIHGANLSLGHSFDARWFACGHSPLCVEVNRLVKSGVVVVVAAGNTGYGVLKSLEGDRNSGLDLTINDPGNAELAITVGATHRDAPHMYGVSYFSSKGPTGDGRLKPDLIAPGERIVSAAAAGSRMADEFREADPFAYCESSGTSMAAPHVSGAVAAFLSIRSEFIGEPEKVKRIFVSTAMDLGRDRYFQGAGMVDLLRAIQSV